MKEQVIASRAPRRGNAPAKGLPQRPMRRDGRAVESDRFSVRSLYAYVPRALKVAVVILAIIGLAIAYRAASSAALFQARAVDVVGTRELLPKRSRVWFDAACLARVFGELICQR